MDEDEVILRKRVVNRQREIEEQLLKDPKGRAVFFVEFPLTPLYIHPDEIYHDPETGLFKLNAGYTIPEGLIPKIKLEDPEQLSTVLGRVLSLNKLKENPIIIFYVKDRKIKPDELAAFNNFKAQHPNFDLQVIDKTEHEDFLGKIAEATYVYHESNESGIKENSSLLKACIFATQIINYPQFSRWETLEGQKTHDAVIDLNKLLVKYGKDPIPLTPTQVPGISNLFTPPPVNETTHPSSTTESCRSQSCTRTPN